MAEPFPTGKHLAKTHKHKQSQLRHEIRPDSSDDGMGLEEGNTQEVHSDIILPETRLECKSDFSTDDGLDTADKAIIQRNSVKKTSKTTLQGSFMTQLFSKAPVQPQESQATSSSTSFSFTPVRKGSVKPPLEDEVASLQSTAQDSTASACIEESKDLPGSSTIAAPVIQSPPKLPDHNKVDVRGSLVLPHLQEYSTPSSVDVSHRDPIATSTGSKSSGHSPYTSSFLSDRSNPPSGNEKVHVFKKGKTGKKILLRQRAGPWPPRSSYDIDQTDRTIIVAHAPPDVLLDPQNSSLSEQNGFHKTASFEKDTKTPSDGKSPCSDVHKCAVQEPQAAGGHILEYKTDAVSVAQCTPQEMVNSTAVACSLSSLHVKEDEISGPPLEHPHTTDSKQPIHSADKECVTELSQPLIHATLEDDQTISLKVTTIGARHSSHDTIACMPNSAGQSSNPKQDIVRDQKLTSQDDEANTISYQRHGQSNSSRVEKASKKLRASCGPLTRLVQGPPIPMDVGHSLENLRIALLADRFRVQHDHSLTTKHHQETTAVLRELIASQSKSLAEWKAKHQDLRTSITRLVEKAKTNQKYVTGLQKDYEKLQKSVIVFQDQNMETLREKIAEVEREKTVLRQEVGSTLEVLSKSQKKLRGTVTDFYMRLVFCKSEKKDLTEHLDKLKIQYEDEYRRRVDLERNLVSSMQAMQHELSDKSTVLIKSVNDLHSSCLPIGPKENKNPEVEECLTILQNLRTTPFLTAKDASKAEAMLRFIHGCIESKLATMTRNLESKSSSTNEIKAFIATQLSNIRSDIVEYKEVVVESGRMLESNNLLQRQLRVQEKCPSDLIRQTRLLHPKEIDSNVQSSCSTEPLSKSGKAHRDHEENLPEPRQELWYMYQRLKETDDQLKAANIKAIQNEGLKQELAKEVAKHQRMYKACKIKLLELGEKEMRRKKIEIATKSWKKSMKQIQKHFNDRESVFRNDIHRLTIERDEIGKRFQDQQKQAFAAKNQMHDLRSSVKRLTSETEILRAQKNEIDTRLAAAHQVALENVNGNPEATSLKDRLQYLTEEIKSMKKTNEALENQYIETSNNARDLQASNDRLKAQISEQRATITNLSKDSDSQSVEAHQRVKESFQAAQKENLVLKRDKLEQIGAVEAKLYNAQATFANERDALERQLDALRAENNDQKDENIRLQANFADETKKLNEKHDAEKDVWIYRLMQSEASLKEAQTRLDCMEAEHRAKPESDRKETEVRSPVIIKEHDRVPRQDRLRNNLSERRLELLSTHHKEPFSSSEDPNVGNYHHRQKRLTFNEIRSHSKQHDVETSSLNEDLLGIPGRQIEYRNSELVSFEGEYGDPAGMRGSTEDYSPTVVDPIDESIPGTQDRVVPATSLELIEETQASTSTELSSISSEELTLMQINVQHSSSPIICAYSQESVAIKSGNMDAKKSPLRLQSVTVPLSQDRPRSQANTASRLMPPPGYHSHHFKRGSHDDRTKINTRHAMCQEVYQTPIYDGKSNTSSSCSATSSLDFMHPSPPLKPTYNDDGSNQKEHDQNTPEDLEQVHVGKRKRSVGQSRQSIIRKKQRTHFQPNSNSPGSSTTNMASSSHKSSNKSPPSNNKLSSSHDVHTSSEVSFHRSQSKRSNNPARRYGQVSSPSRSHGYDKHEGQPFQSQVTNSGRDAPSRLTRSKSRRSNESYDARFGQELGLR